MPTPLMDVPFVIFVEQEIKQKSATTSASEGPENLADHDKFGAIAATKKSSLVNDTSGAKLEKISASIPLPVKPQAFAKKASEKSADRTMNGPKSTPITSPSLANKKYVKLNAKLLSARDDYTRFLQMIERREVATSPSQPNDNKNFAVVSQSSSKIASAQNKSNFINKINTNRIQKTQCSDIATTAQAHPSDKTKSNQRLKWGSNQIIRITSLVGHGRYATPSTSVRVSDLLTAQPRRMPARYPNASVTVSDLLRQNVFNSQIACN